MTCQRAPFRLLRTAAVATPVLSLAAAAHVAGGGRLPQAPVLAACTALVFLMVIVLTRWKLQMPALAVVLAGGQGLLHILLSALSPAAADTAVASAAAGASLSLSRRMATRYPSDCKALARLKVSSPLPLTSVAPQAAKDFHPYW